MPSRKALGDNPLDDLMGSQPPAAAAPRPARALGAASSRPAPSAGRRAAARASERLTEQGELTLAPVPPPQARWYRLGAYLEPEQGRWLDQTRAHALAEGRRNVGVSDLVRLALQRLADLSWPELLEQLDRQSASQEKAPPMMHSP